MQRVGFWIRASLGSVGFVLSVAWGAALLLVPISRARRRQGFARAISRLCCPPLGIRVRVEGAGSVGRGPYVYAINHQSQIDYPIVFDTYRPDALIRSNTVMLASQIGDWPVLGPLWRASGMLTVDRHIPHRAGRALEACRRAIDDGGSVLMFVEGTRGRVAGQLGPFKRGAFRLAVEAGVPVLPIVVSPLKPWTDLRGRRLVPHEVIVCFLDPVSPDPHLPTGEAERRLGEQVRGVMLATLERLASATGPRVGVSGL